MQTLSPSNLYSLTSRIALVTGGGTGIGLMISRGLATAGAKVYIAGRRLDVLEGVAKGWNAGVSEGTMGKMIPIQLDVTNKESVAKAVETIQTQEGKLHILINNAGQVGPRSPFLSNPSAPENANPSTLGTALFQNESFESWASLYTINTSSIFFTTTAFLGLLAAGSADVEDYWSSVVNITSISGVIKLAQEHFCYNSAKAAASHLTRMFSAELAIKNIPIRVNAISPGVYASEMTYDVITPDLVNKIGKGLQPVPAKRAGTEEEMAGTVVFLVSRAGGYVQGQEIQVDGGYTSVNPAVV